MAALLWQDAASTHAYGRVGLTILMGAITVCFLDSFMDALERDGGLHIESSWGGLGGGVGGFRISRSVLYLAGAVCFGGLCVLAYYPSTVLQTPAAPTQTAQTKEGETKKESNTTSAAVGEAKPGEHKAPEIKPAEKK